jgi:hypothetical protein
LSAAAGKRAEVRGRAGAWQCRSGQLRPDLKIRQREHEFRFMLWRMFASLTGNADKAAPVATQSAHRLEPDRFGLKQEGSRFFEKKRRKKLLLVWACGAETSTAKSEKVFLLLFVHKKKSSSSLKHDPS